MDLSHLYEELVERFAQQNIIFSKDSNGYAIEYSLDCENYVAKLLQDFYHLIGYNVLLLNQNGKCRLCLEVQNNDDLTLLRDIHTSLMSYMNEVDYVSLMERDVKAYYNLFKKSLRYPGNFGIGVKNLEADAYN